MSVRSRPPWPGDLANRERYRSTSYRRSRDPRLERLCRLCARIGLPTFRHLWHPKCSELASAIYQPWIGIQWVMRRQRGLCAGCRNVLAKPKPNPKRSDHAIYWEEITGPGVEIDHIVPLWKVALMPPERQTIRWWLPGNLQGLCRICHRDKTKAEAAERAQSRKRTTQRTTKAE